MKSNNFLEILYVEDEETQRKQMKEIFSQDNAHVYTVGSYEEAIIWLEQNKDKVILDVVILDMELGSNHDGIDVGKEIVNAYLNKRPEFIVWSNFREPEYLEGSINLGVAKYLYKHDIPLHTLKFHIIALALRKRLRMKTNNLFYLKNIIKKSITKQHALRSFCNTLKEEINTCLRIPYFLACSIADNNYFYLTNTEESLLFVKAIQIYIHMVLRKNKPFLLTKKDMKKFAEEESIEANRHYSWENNYIIKLLSHKEIKLSLLLPPCNQYDEQEFAKTLQEYLDDPIREGVMEIIVEWVSTESERKTMQSAISRFCLYSGQQLLSLLSQGVDSGEIKYGDVTTRIQETAKSLYDTGELLTVLNQKNFDFIYKDIKNLGENLQQIIKQITDLPTLEKTSSEIRLEDVSIVGDKKIKLAKESYLNTALTNILTWFAERNYRLYKGNWPGNIDIELLEDNSYIVVVVRDKSKRLPKKIRELLFEPFTSGASIISRDFQIAAKENQIYVHTPLFIARTIIEIHNGGLILDSSDNLTGEIGNEFRIHLISGGE